MEAGARGDSFTFSAFISYARGDRAEAVRLQRRLEQYRLDADLRTREADRVLPARPLQPVFRDEDELVPGQDLPERIRKGLSAARFLIVMASPAAARSAWVEKEILDFMAMGKAASIIVLAIDGVPNAVKAGEAEERECLPRPFRVVFDADRQPTAEAAAEPNWVDWRAGGKRDRINFLRLVAALLQLERFDELLRRDAQAQQRRLRLTQAIAGAMGLLFIGAVAASWAAFEQRTRALTAESNFLAIQSREVGAPGGDWRRGDAVRAMRIALEGAPAVQGALLDRPTTESIDDVLRSAGPAIDRLKAVLRGHRGGVEAVAFSPDGATILTAANDKTAALWPAAGGPAKRVLPHDAEVSKAVFSKDGARIATVCWDKTVRVFSGSGEPLATLRIEAPQWPTALAFSPDGRVLVTGASDGLVRVWDADNGALLRTLRGHQKLVLVVGVSPDGSKIVSGSWDTTARVWDLATGRLLHTLTGHQGLISDAAFSPDGSQIATGSSDATAVLWNVSSGKPVRAFHGHSGNFMSLGFAPDGTKLVTASNDDTARVWDTTGQRYGITRRMSVAPDQRDLIAVLKGHKGWVLVATFSPDGAMILTAADDGTARLWEADGAPIAVFSGHTDGVPAAAFSPDGTTAATASSDGTVRLWDARGASPPRWVESGALLARRACASLARHGKIKLRDEDARRASRAADAGDPCERFGLLHPTYYWDALKRVGIE